MAYANHNDAVVINITLSAAPSQRAGFGNVLYLVDQVTNSLNTERYVVYTSAAGAENDYDDGYISAQTLSVIQAVFSQNRKPKQFLVGRVNTAGAETYVQALAACEEAGANYFVLTADVKTAAVQVAISAAIETRDKLYYLQSSDADWLAGTFPTDWADVEGRENTVINYHDDDDEPMDVVYAAERCTFDPDVISAQHSPVELKEINNYNLTETQKTNALANYANLGLVMGPGDFVVRLGRNAAGRAIEEMVTKYWLKARMQEDVFAHMLAKSARGSKFEVNAIGSAELVNLTTARFAIGIQARHFERVDQTSIEVTSLDVDTATFNVAASAKLVTSGQFVNYEFNISRDDVV